MSSSRSISESVKKRVAGRQYYKCANSSINSKKLRGLENFNCPLWKINGINKGNFNESGYEIDHINEFSITRDNSENNLQALCLMCHSVKTKRFVTNSSKIKTYKQKSEKTELAINYKSNISNLNTKKLETFLSSMTIKQLKHICDIKGVSKTGNKDDIIYNIVKISKRRTEQDNLIQFYTSRVFVYDCIIDEMSLPLLRKLCKNKNLAVSGSCDTVITRLLKIENIMKISHNDIIKLDKTLKSVFDTYNDDSDTEHSEFSEDSISEDSVISEGELDTSCWHNMNDFLTNSCLKQLKYVCRILGLSVCGTKDKVREKIVKSGKSFSVIMNKLNSKSSYKYLLVCDNNHKCYHNRKTKLCRLKTCKSETSVYDNEFYMTTVCKN